MGFWNRSINLRPFCSRFSVALAALCLLSACATGQDKQEEVNLARLEQEAYQPITRLAFAKEPNRNESIVVVRNVVTSTEVSAIETAAGVEKTKVIEH